MSGGSDDQTVGYRYYMVMHLGICTGPVDAMLAATAGDRDLGTGTVTTSGQTYINKPDLFGGEDREGGIQGNFWSKMGDADQGPDFILSRFQTGPQPAYRGIFGLIYDGLVSCNNPYVKPFAFKVRRILKGWLNDTPWYQLKASIILPNGDYGANPAHILYECITNPDWGMGYSPGVIDDASFRAAADVFYAEGLGLCMMWTRQSQLQDFMGIVVNHAGAVMGQDRRTGLFVLKPMRADYDVDDLPVFNESNVLSVDSYQRPAIPEAVNEVTVVYTDVATGKPAGVTVQNLANITAQGGVVSESKQYPGLPTGPLASRVAMRDLQAVSTPLAKVRLQVNRTGYNLLPGDVIRWSWPKLGIENLVLRVLQAGAGTLTNGAIALDCSEDVFGLPSATYTAQEPSGWQDPATDPAPASNRVVQEASYFQVMRTMSPGDLAVLPEDAGFISTLAVRPSSDSIRYRIRQRYGSSGSFVDGGVGEFCPSATLAAGISHTSTSITFATSVDEDMVEIPDGGLYAFIGSEVVRVETFNPVTLAATIGRGCLDTVAAAHASGARLYFAHGYESSDGIERVDGDTVQVKLLPSTGRGVLAEVSAPTDSIVMDQRPFRPYPPGRLRINTTAYPSSVATALTVSWAHRSRLQQNLEGDETGDIGPEAGTTYTVQVWNDTTSTMIAEQTGITGTSASFPSLTGFFDCRIEAWSVRDGLASRQKHAYVFDLEIPVSDTAPAATMSAATSLIAGAAYIPSGATASGVTLTATASLVAGGAAGDNGTDEHFDHVVLLLHFNGTDASTTFVDSSTSGKTPTQIGGSAQIDTAQSKFGGASGLFNGGVTTDGLRYLDQADFGFGTGDFTIEFWIRPAGGGNQTVVSMLQSGRATTPHLYLTSGCFAYYVDGANRITGAATVTIGAWSHVAISRVSGSTRLFVNGVQDGSTYSDASNYGSTQQFTVGDYANPLSGGSTLSGWLDDLRVTKGVGRYSAGFTPPAAAFPDIGPEEDLGLMFGGSSYTPPDGDDIDLQFGSTYTPPEGG